MECTVAYRPSSDDSFTVAGKARAFYIKGSSFACSHSNGQSPKNCSILDCHYRITVGREIGISGRLAIPEYKDVNGVQAKMNCPTVKLTSFDLLGRKPEAEEEMGEVKESATNRKRKTSA